MKKVLTFLLLTFSLSLFSQNSGDWPASTLTSSITYHDEGASSSNVGNGFLVRHKGKTYAVTAKHTLLIAKTESMKTAVLNDDLKEWIFYHKDNQEERVVLGELLNPSPLDSLSWPAMMRTRDRYVDWLAFSIKENHSKLTPLKIRRSALKKGEKLFAIGWTYADQDGPQRVYEYEYHGPDATNFNMRKIKAPENAGGLSGSPVVDAKGRLVGIVSRTGRAPETGEQFNTPCSVRYLLEILESL